MSAARRRRPGARGGAGAAAKDHLSEAEFWGRAADEDDDDIEGIRPSDDPTALIRSLGPAPLPGRETVAEHYFAAVYEKAGALAIALASASDLLDLDDEDDDRDAFDFPAGTPRAPSAG